MAILTNTMSDVGADQKKVMDFVLHLYAITQGISRKLDADAAVTETDYQANLEQVIASGAVPVVDGSTLTAIIAQYDAD